MVCIYWRVAQDLDDHQGSIEYLKRDVLGITRQLSRPWDGQICSDMLDQELDFEAALKAKLSSIRSVIQYYLKLCRMGRCLQFESCIHGTFWDKFMITTGWWSSNFASFLHWLAFCPGQIHIYIGKAGGLWVGTVIRAAPLSTRVEIFNSRCTICMRNLLNPWTWWSIFCEVTRLSDLLKLVSSSFLKSSFFPSFPIMINAFYRKTADDGTSTSIPHIFLGLCLGSTLWCREHSVMNRLRRGTWVVVLLAPVVPVQSFLSCQGW